MSILPLLAGPVPCGKLVLGCVTAVSGTEALASSRVALLNGHVGVSKANQLDLIFLLG